MEREIESACDMNDVSTQLVEEEKRPTVLPLENAKKAKPAASDDQDREAMGKMIPHDKINSNKDASEVKFLSADSQNGDAKIDIENLKLIFTGMTKEELMKFSKDPFWIRLRWFLFILFWILWLAMLAGAIAIIVVAPKCAPPAPLKWWEQGPLYEIYVRSYKDGGDDVNDIGDLKGLTSEVQYINDIGSTGIILSSIFKTDNDEGAIESFTDIDPVYGSLEDFKSLLAALKNRSLHLVLNFVPNHTSKKHPWFIASENGNDTYIDYYVWAPSKGKNDTGGEIPPNNWVSVNGGSAWEWSSKRGMFYLHQFGKDEPDLNMRNPKVVAEIKKVLKYWLDMGVSGFQLEKVEFLLEDQELRDESRKNIPSEATHLDWGFYTHFRTTNVGGILDILFQWKETISSFGDGERILMVKGDALKNSLYQYSWKNSSMVVDLIYPTETFSALKEGFTADDLHEAVKRILDESKAWNEIRPVWQLSGSHNSRIATRVSRDAVDGLTMLVMLLPGTPITLYGDELAAEGPSNASMLWTNSSNGGVSEADSSNVLRTNFDISVASQQTDGSHLSLYKELVNQRESPSIMYGSCTTSVVNGTVFVLTRIKSGNPGILLAFNPSSNNVTVNLKDIKSISNELTVKLQSSNYGHHLVKLKSTVSTVEVPLPAKTALVFSFVPKLDS